MKPRKLNLLKDLGLIPEIGGNLPALLNWLSSEKLVAQSTDFDFDADTVDPTGKSGARLAALAQATGRHAVRPYRQDELKALKERYKSVTPAVDEGQVWEALRNPKGAMRELQWDKLPADAMAFYRPFHFQPHDQWGIYLMIAPLLQYHRQLLRQSLPLQLFTAGSLMHLVLFEVFNHEFFHHLVESTATTLEVLLATQGEPQPVYLSHRRAQRADAFKHPHAPLEEALANAYAYNALGFISRVKAGYKTVSIKIYQQAVAQYWPSEPAGYRSARHYIGDGYIHGGAMLLAQLLQQPDAMHHVPLAVVAKHVMPSGFMSLVAKPDIPTWLVGSDEELTLFKALVPAPNEAYTQLFWPYNTEALDKSIERRLAEERQKKADAIAALKGKNP